MSAPAVATGSSGQFTADLTALTRSSSTLTSLAGQSGTTAGDLGKLVLDVLSFAQIGSSVGTANTSLQTALNQALSKVSTVLQDVGRLVGVSAQSYQSADQQVAQSLGSGGSDPRSVSPAGTASPTTAMPGQTMPGQTGTASSTTATMSTTATSTTGTQTTVATAGTGPATDGDAYIDHFAASHKQGDTGADVRKFQRELQQIGYDSGKPDGQWGPATQAALARYQAEHHYVAGAGSGTDIDLPGALPVVHDAPNDEAAKAVRSALSQTGVPYHIGGKVADRALDCSGLTAWAYKQAGVSLPAFSTDQAVGQHIAAADIKPGDLAVWRGTTYGHVAMYIGDGKYVEAPHTGENVRITPMYTQIKGHTFLGFYRPSVKP